MGLFDSLGDNGWLSYASRPNPDYNKRFSLADLLEQAKKFYGGGAQASPAVPPMPAPINVGSLPQPINRAGLDERAYGAPQPGNPLQPPQTMLPPEAANAMAQAPQTSQLAAPQQSFGGPPNPLHAIGGVLGGLGDVLNPTRGSLTDLGTDPFTGMKQYGVYDPVKKTLVPVNGAASHAAGQSTNEGLAQFEQAQRSGVTGEALYDYLPPSMRNMVKQYIENRAPIPTAAAMRNPAVLSILSAANAIDPSFNAAEYPKRVALYKNYLAGGKQFQELQAINTVAGHLHDMMDVAKKLDNFENLGPLNGPANYLLKGYRSAAQDPRLSDFDTVKQAISNELSKAYRGGHVTEGDVKEWNDNLNAAQTPEQLRTVIGRLNSLLMSKREAIEQGYREGLGKSPLPKEFSSVSESSRKKFDDIAAYASGGSSATSAATPTQSAPTATGPNGQKLILKSGQWVPLR